MSKLIRSITALALGLGFALTTSGAASSASRVPQAGDGQIEPPTIIPREVWGAREPTCEWAGQDGNRVTHVVIHHSYEPTDPPSLESAYAAIRHIQNLHMDDNGWCDVGYSYIVDWFGNVYEGSKGTIDRPITSAHTSGFNYEGVGIVMIGNYMEETPSAQTVAAAGRVAGWVLGWYGFDGDQEVQIRTANGNNKFRGGTTVTVPAITGHRDLVNTECPGDVGYTMLPYIRDEAASITTAMHANGTFGGGVGNSAAIFALGEPSYPIGGDAQDALEIAEADHLVLAEEASDTGEEVSEHAPATEPDDGDDAADLVDGAPIVAPSSHLRWLWALIPLALLAGLGLRWRQRNPAPALVAESAAVDNEAPVAYSASEVTDDEDNLRS